jgi:hypothetical protein
MKYIEIKLVKPTTEKLKFVKLIKDCSGLSLKESKDLCDSIHALPERVNKIPIRDGENDYRKMFVNEIKNIDGLFIINGGVQWDRNVKMLKLGISEKSDYIEFMKDYILNRFENSEELLTFVLNKFSKEELQEVFNRINIEL